MATAVGITSEERVYVRNVHAPHAVRRFVHAMLSEWGLRQLMDDMELVASELATNAVQCAIGDTIAVRLERDAGAVCVKVWDDSPESPSMGAPNDTDDERGRGLMITAAISERCGHYRVPSGKVVWAAMKEADR
jgi:anti-sigma regulatory factor (Ser/Thr protein kinase)